MVRLLCGCRMAAWMLVALVLAMSSACVSLADRIVDPQSMEIVQAPSEFGNVLDWTGTVTNTMHTPLGLEIAWYRVPPEHRGWTYTFERSDHSMYVDFGFGVMREMKPLPPKGTIVFLHGWGMDAKSMLPWAWAMAEQGYQGIAMDLRNFGRSGKAPVGFGPREAQDVLALFNVLVQRGELVYPVYLFGVSYGAATALFTEPMLRNQLSGIVAMESYANASEAIQDLVAGMLDTSGGGIFGWLKHIVLSLQYGNPAQVQQAIAEAGRRLDLDLAAVDVAAALSRSETCTLLLHGAKDRLIPVEVARRLATINPLVHYVELPEDFHVTVPLRVNWLDDPIASWLNATARGGCPSAALPPDPTISPDSAPQ